MPAGTAWTPLPRQSTGLARAVVVLAVAVSLVAGACTGGGEPTGTPTPGPPSPGATGTTPTPGPALDAAQLQGELIALLQEQVYWAGQVALVARDRERGPRSPHFRAASRLLARTAERVAEALASALEGGPGPQVARAWEAHARALVGFARHLARGGSTRGSEARAHLEAFPDELAAALDEEAAPQVRTAAEGYTRALASALALQRVQNPGRFRALRQAADGAAALAGTLLGAAQLLLPGRVVGSVVPDPDASPVGLRAALVEHVHLLALLTGTGADPRLGPGTRAFASAARTVQDNADELARILGGAVGRDPVVLSEAWMEHVRSLAQYTVASRLGAEAGAADARGELEAFPGRWGRLLGRATGGALSREEATRLFRAHVRAMLALADLQLEGSPRQYGQLARAVGTIGRAASALAAALPT